MLAGETHFPPPASSSANACFLKGVSRNSEYSENTKTQQVAWNLTGLSMPLPSCHHLRQLLPQPQEEKK